MVRNTIWICRLIWRFYLWNRFGFFLFLSISVCIVQCLSSLITKCAMHKWLPRNSIPMNGNALSLSFTHTIYRSHFVYITAPYMYIKLTLNKKNFCNSQFNLRWLYHGGCFILWIIRFKANRFWGQKTFSLPLLNRITYMHRFVVELWIYIIRMPWFNAKIQSLLQFYKIKWTKS